MVGGTHLYGGFNIPPSLALKVFEVVREISVQDVNATLSHVDDDNCEMCRGAAKPPGEVRHDAARASRPGREWTA